MKPSEVSNTLRRIATAIDNSVNPKREIVAKDLRRVIAVVNDELLDNVDINSLPVLEASGEQDRFIHKPVFTPQKAKLVSIDKSWTGNWTPPGSFLKDPGGDWTMFWLTRLTKNNRKDREYEFATNGDVVVQHMNWDIVDKRNEWANDRGGISQADIDYMKSLA
jgi:hypothetical protein